MNRKMDQLDLLSLAMIGASVFGTIAVYHRLPDPMPTHFDAYGVPNGWMSRPFGAFVLPVTALFIWGLVRFGSSFLAAAAGARMSASPVSAIALLVVALNTVLQALMLRAGMASVPRLSGGVWIVLGIFFVLLGLLLPRVRKNPWIGIRTPWTLASDENWARTHRFAGYTMSAGGVLAVVAALAGAPMLGVIFILGGALAPVVYSWRLARGS